MKFSLQKIAEATKGTLYIQSNEQGKDIYVTGVSTDSRGDVTGRLFVPIAGPAFDGHDYIQTAFSKGAVCTLTEHEPTDRSFPHIKVSSTRQALMDLAAYDRDCFTGPVVAITGSVGKTTTKEIIASVLSQKYRTLKTLGNFNNDIGLPLTLLAREADHEAMVLEMGMNHLGEIRVLSKIGKPDICLITNIGDAHIENLGSRKGILKAKSEIFEGMRPGGTVILNGDDPLLAGRPKVPHAGRTIYCYMADSMGNSSDTALPKGDNWVSVTMIDHLGLQGTNCDISWRLKGAPVYSTNRPHSNMHFSSDHPAGEYLTGHMQVHIPLPGDHMIMNAMMAFAVGLELGLTPSEIAMGIKEFKPPGHRMAITEVNGMTIVNDCYNASPSSMNAAVDMLVGSLKMDNRRKVCIFGDMFELGDHGELLHKEVGQYAAAKKVDLLIAIGPLSRHMYEAFKETAEEEAAASRGMAAPLAAVYFQTKEDFIAKWKKYLQPGDMVLIKASRGMALESVAEAIT